MAYFNAGFWSYHLEAVFVSEIRAFERAAIERVLPAFENLEAEADAYANAEYERLGALPGDGNVDMGDLADIAQDAGIREYEELTGVRQAMLNLMAAALYHLAEQQLFLFYRRQVLEPREEDDISLYTWAEVHKRLAEKGIILKNLNAWKKFRELELVTNVVKHGDGRSAQLLKEVNPQILTPELFRGDARMGKPVGRVGTPLSGDGVYVTPDELREYAKAAISFWSDLATAIRNAEDEGA